MFPAWRADLVGVVGELDAAGLATAADLHLGLDDDGVPGSLGLGDRLVDRDGDAARTHGDAVAGEVLLALVFEQIHAAAHSCLAIRCPWAVPGAAARPKAWSTPSVRAARTRMRAPARSRRGGRRARARRPCSRRLGLWPDLRRGAGHRRAAIATASRRRAWRRRVPVGGVESVAETIDETGPILFPGLNTSTGERTLVLDHRATTRRVVGGSTSPTRPTATRRAR